MPRLTPHLRRYIVLVRFRQLASSLIVVWVRVLPSFESVHVSVPEEDAVPSAFVCRHSVFTDRPSRVDREVRVRVPPPAGAVSSLPLAVRRDVERTFESSLIESNVSVEPLSTIRKGGRKRMPPAEEGTGSFAASGVFASRVRW